VRAIHHSAIVTSDFESSLRFWRDGLGLVELLDYEFKGDWPTLFGVDVDLLRSVFLGDSERPDSGVVELVQFIGGQVEDANPGNGPRFGFFLLSLERDVDATLAALADLGFVEGVRRINMPAPAGKTVPMAVVTAPDGVRVELIGAPS
jgi:catechol 2,3-dioxygenase-like lactoylglutathione lyase family enzyme